MLKSLSKSVKIMFIFDLLTFIISTTLIYAAFELPQNFKIATVAITTLTGLFALFLKANYKIREFNITLKNAYLLFEGVLFAHIPPAILLALFTSKMESLKFLAANIFAVFTVLYLYRILFHLYLFHFKKIKNVLIVGTNKRAKILAKAIRDKQALKMNLVGFVKSAKLEKTLSEISAQAFNFNLSDKEKQIIEQKIQDERNFTFENVPVFENAKELYKIVETNNVDIVIFTEPSMLASAVPDNTKIYLMPEFYEMVTGKFFVDDSNVYNLAIKLKKQDNDGLYNFFKRIFDIISASIILFVTLPVTLYIAIRVKLLDGGNPLFTQTRVGRNGNTFECYKLRTMYMNDYVPKNAEMLNDGSDRVIPFCKIIRKAKLDEIPQMINIIKGEMSIVGPRAEWEKFVNVFKGEIPYYTARMWVKTGWTGWAHVSMPAAYSVDEEKERLAYDLYYIKHRNLFLDLSILVKAVFLAISGRHM